MRKLSAIGPHASFNHWMFDSNPPEAAIKVFAFTFAGLPSMITLALRNSPSAISKSTTSASYKIFTPAFLAAS